MIDPVPLWEKRELRAAAGETLRPGGFSLTDRAVDMIGVLPGWLVLDVGGGLGATVGRLRSRYGAIAWGVESSSEQIRRAGNGANLLQAQGDALPFQDGSFHAVFCECVLSLFGDPERGLGEFHRVLRPDGFLVLADLCAQGAPPSTVGSCADRAMPLASTRAMVEAHGFVIRQVEDHSRHLKELAARLVLAGESDRCTCERNPGYYLMIAQKRGLSHVG